VIPLNFGLEEANDSEAVPEEETARGNGHDDINRRSDRYEDRFRKEL